MGKNNQQQGGVMKSQQDYKHGRRGLPALRSAVITCFLTEFNCLCLP